VGVEVCALRLAWQAEEDPLWREEILPEIGDQLARQLERRLIAEQAVGVHQPVRSA